MLYSDNWCGVRSTLSHNNTLLSSETGTHTYIHSHAHQIYNKLSVTCGSGTRLKTTVLRFPLTLESFLLKCVQKDTENVSWQDHLSHVKKKAENETVSQETPSAVCLCVHCSSERPVRNQPLSQSVSVQMAAASHHEPTDSPVQRESAFNALLDVQSVC